MCLPILIRNLLQEFSLTNTPFIKDVSSVIHDPRSDLRALETKDGISTFSSCPALPSASSVDQMVGQSNFSGNFKYFKLALFVVSFIALLGDFNAVYSYKQRV